MVRHFNGVNGTGNGSLGHLVGFGPWVSVGLDTWGVKVLASYIITRCLWRAD